MRDFSDPVTLVAPTLLGSVLHIGPVSLRITEVEAYGSWQDPASHAYRGRTQRNEAMFGPAGTLYCYLSHGIHTAVNIVCGPESVAQAVLIRAGDVVDGLQVARSRRGFAVPDERLGRGPGCVGQALGLTVADSGRWIGTDDVSVTAPRAPVTFLSGPRVGVRRAPNLPWRFWIPAEPSVSAYRRHRSAPPPPGTLM